MAVVIGQNTLVRRTRILVDERDDSCPTRIGHVQLEQPVHGTGEEIRRQHDHDQSLAREAQRAVAEDAGEKRHYRCLFRTIQVK